MKESPVEKQARLLQFKMKQVQKEITYVTKRLDESLSAGGRVDPEQLVKLVVVAQDLIRETYLLAGFQNGYDLKKSE